jgi:hypothetical protein
VNVDDTEAITTPESGASSTPAASTSTSVSGSLTSKVLSTVKPESQFASVGLQSSSFPSEQKQQADRKKGWFYFF